jgi:hypothetical protein
MRNTDTSGAAVSDWQSIFNERGAMLAFFGMLGAAVRSAALKTTWREGLRVVFIGGATSFGFGALSPHLLQQWIGDIPDNLGTAIGTMCAASFLVGLMAVTIIERIAAGKSPLPGRDGDEAM